MATWRSRRRVAALAQGALILSLPFLTVDGESALRFDLSGMKLLSFGKVLWISEFHLVLLGTLAFLLVTLAVTVVFGRIWCGWLCPQTVLPELCEWAVSIFPPGWRRPGRTLFLFLLSGVVSFSLISYFLPPAEAAVLLFRSRIVTGFFVVQWAVLFPMLALVGPTFCRTVCPYSMLQNVLFDAKTLTVAFDPERSGECLRCGACVEACPVRIDIREGAQRECIACAECIDACRGITEPEGIRPFIGYRGAIARPKAAAWGAAAAAACLAFLFLLFGKSAVEFLVQWEAKVPGGRANSYRYALRNDAGTPIVLVLRVEGGGKIYGDREFLLSPHARKTGTVIVREEGSMGSGVTFVAEGRGISMRRKAGFP